MPLYDFRCVTCGDTEAAFAMAEVPAEITCPGCQGSAGRRIGSPGLHRQTTAKTLIEATTRTAEEPSVVSSLPQGNRRSRPHVSRNPLHAQLPRP